MILSLIGLPGSGKSTVSSLIGKLLNKQVVDMDSVFETDQACTVAEYFEANGEDAFRVGESNLLATVLQSDDIVLSTGGGVILQQENRRLLRSLSCVVYLNANPDFLVSRLSSSSHRPHFYAQDPSVRIKTLWTERSALYLQTAHFAIAVDNKSPQNIAEEVIDVAF